MQAWQADLLRVWCPAAGMRAPMPPIGDGALRF